jgi:putative transposase
MVLDHESEHESHWRASGSLDLAKLSGRDRRDLPLKPKIAQVFAQNFEIYGARKVWRQLGRAGIPVARCTMGEMGL